MHTKTANKKSLIALITVVLLFAATLSASMITVQAQDDTPHGGSTEGMPGGSIPLPAGVTPDVTYPTLAYVNFRPDPIGLGQPLLVNVWLQPPIHVARYFKNAFLVTLTKPDGTTDEIGPLTSYYGDGTSWFEYPVDQVGTWQIKFDFLGAYFPPGNYTSGAAFTLNQTLNAPLGVYYAPSSDGPYDFVVQNDFALSWPPSPLPTDYWTRPVNLEHREWWPILGGYPNTGIVGGGPSWPAETNPYMSNYDFYPYVQGPKSAHIAWRRQDQISGLVGGTLGQIALDGRPSSPSIIYSGRCYQSITKVFDGVTQSVWQCYDLRTGEIIWEKTGINQAPTIISYVERTVSIVPGEEARKSGLTVELLYVGSGRVIAYDPNTGSVNYNISISPLTTGTYVANPSVFLTVQNLGGGNYRLINWTVTGTVTFPTLTNRRLGVISNISWPFSDLGTVDYQAGVAVSTSSITPSSTGVSYAQNITAASLTTGQVLWSTTTDVSMGYEGFFSGSTRIADQGKFAVRLNDGYWHCWDLRTGQKLWKSELSSQPWGIWGIYGVGSAYGFLYYPQYDGVVAYDWDDGSVAWRYKYVAPYPFETVYSDSETGEALVPFYQSSVRIADGILYQANDEHSVSNPLPRGWKIHAINATTGEGIWNITGHYQPGGIADGYLTAGNRDGFLYVFGKGKSATTVTAPLTSVPKGEKVLIQGTVTDLSPAQPGTPCISKDSMGVYMEYLHMQKPIPSGYVVTGVPVQLLAISSGGSVVEIGTVTSDVSGTFKAEWSAPEEGLWTVTANFAGDDSYGSSWAETGLSVGPAVQVPSGNGDGTGAQPDNTMLLYGILAAVVIAIVIGLVAILLVLRKR